MVFSAPGLPWPVGRAAHRLAFDMRPVPLALSLLCLSTSALAAEAWETVQEGAIVIKTRQKPGTEVKEVWAEGLIAAEVQDIQTTLMTPDRFAKFMPYVKEAREFGKPDADGGAYVYTRLDLPWVKARDYVTKVFLEEGVKPDGSGAFRNRWVATPDKIPHRNNIIRLKYNEGSWHVTGQGEGKSHAVYRFSVDPGGWIPGFAADMGNTKGVTDTFRAVEAEAQRLGRERKASPPSAVNTGATPEPK